MHSAGQRSLSGWMQVKVSQSTKESSNWKVSTNLATPGERCSIRLVRDKELRYIRLATFGIKAEK
jgi:hypothetical protein